jgi:hypothetical protein
MLCFVSECFHAQIQAGGAAQDRGSQQCVFADPPPFFYRSPFIEKA